MQCWEMRKGGDQAFLHRGALPALRRAQVQSFVPTDGVLGEFTSKWIAPLPASRMNVRCITLLSLRLPGDTPATLDVFTK